VVFKRALVLSMLFSSFYSYSENLATPASEQFSEHFSSNVPVSGNILVGALYSGASISDQFYLNAVNETSDFCFSVSSIDGTYISENNYRLQSAPDIDDPVVPIQYPTQFADLISNFSIDQLAPLATGGSCDNQKNLDILLASREQDISNASILFLVSSGRSDVFLFLTSSSGAKKRAKCQRIEHGKRTAFDTVCEISANSLDENSYEGKLIRRKIGGREKPVLFTLKK